MPSQSSSSDAKQVPKSWKAPLGTIMSMLFCLPSRFLLLLPVHMVELADGRVAFGRCSPMPLPFVEDVHVFNFICCHFPRFVALYFSFRSVFSSLDLLAKEEDWSCFCWPVCNHFCCCSSRSLRCSFFLVRLLALHSSNQCSSAYLQR